MKRLPILMALAGVACGDKDDTTTDSGSVNTAPDTPVIVLTPEAPTTLDFLSVEATATDPDGDDLAISYEWDVDGTAWSNDDVVPSDDTAKGQTWTVTATASDGDLTSVATASVTIANSAPGLDEVSITPEPAFTTDTLTCEAPGSADPDDDVITVNMEWTVDGERAGEGPTLSSDAFVKGQEVTCTAIPHDGEDAGDAVHATLVIQNTAPEAPAVSIDPTEGNGTQDLVCRVDLDSPDADDDPITYTMSWTADGAIYPDDFSNAVGPSTTTWPDDTVPADDTLLAAEWTCTVLPNDGDADGPTASATATVDPSCDAIEVGVAPGWGSSGWNNGSLAWGAVATDSATLGCEITFTDLSQPFSLSDLTAYEAVLIPNVAGGTTQYSASEITALQDYADQGYGGLVATYVLNWSTYVHDDLLAWFGVNSSAVTDTSEGSSNTWAILSSHAVTTDLSTGFDSGGYAQAQVIDETTALMSDTERVASTTAGSVIVHDGQHRAVWITQMVEYSSTTEDGRRLLYNSLVWAAGYAP